MGGLMWSEVEVEDLEPVMSIQGPSSRTAVSDDGSSSRHKPSGNVASNASQARSDAEGRRDRDANGSSRNRQAKRSNGVESAVTRLLVAIKELLEGLTAWANHQATESQISDFYVRFGNEFNAAVIVFGSIGLDLGKLKSIPEELREILERCLAEEASIENLQLYLPSVRKIITRLLKGLRRRQDEYRLQTGSSSESSRPSRSANVTDSEIYPISPTSSLPVSTLPGTRSISTAMANGNDAGDEFVFPRPANHRDIENMFEGVRQQRDLGDVNMTIEQKWETVHAHEKDKWNQRKRNEAQQQKSAAKGNGLIAKDIPEWYITKFIDKTITAKHVGSLTVSLRTLSISWMHHFVTLQGIQVIGHALKSISLKGTLRRKADVELEYELLKCLKILLNHETGANDAITHPLTIDAIACSLSAVDIPSRRLVAEILTFFCYYNDGVAHESVLKAMDALGAANNQTGRYDFWFQSLLTTLSDNGKMGSLVGASQDIRKHHGSEAALIEYAEINLFLINGILDVDDFELRLHYRFQMEAAGVRKILNVCHEFQQDSLEKQIAAYEKLAAADQEAMIQNLDLEDVMSLKKPKSANIEPTNTRDDLPHDTNEPVRVGMAGASTGLPERSAAVSTTPSVEDNLVEFVRQGDVSTSNREAEPARRYESAPRATTPNTNSQREESFHQESEDLSSLEKPQTHSISTYKAEESSLLDDASIGVSLTTKESSIYSLETLMTIHTPVDLTGLVSIPDRSHPEHGGLADVHAGLLKDQPVAVKILRIRKHRRMDQNWEESNQRRINREMHVWAALKHQNICEFLGYSTEFSDYPAMISTWCHRGTASEYLESQRLTLEEKVKMARDTSDGLQYLHQLKVIHGDLKPSNVLVDSDGVAKLCDFGLVRLADWEGPAGMTTTSAYTGTERYKAPELFISPDNRCPVATIEGDIYSLRCIMLEFVEQLYPFQRFRKPNDLRGAIMDGCSPSLRTESNNALGDLNEYFWNLLEACWGEPSVRPNIRIIIDALDYFEQSLAAA